ncbi:uncharacterized protein K02A2.6-like [Xyrichtys novacula]|uniref:Uncharacterized protein K02A2.6-like n=1 Tax=Xyrichtys novacula TaxID=13765 RepID=A0AAV1FK41_XYRNO|nr:uncharacterized protein K02A2.6-like [Xyrichtys novacula]
MTGRTRRKKRRYTATETERETLVDVMTTEQPEGNVNVQQRGVSMAASAPTATVNIQPPETFDFSKPLEWTKWIRRFERFRQASNLTTNSEENKVNTLIYCMGDEADDVLRGLKLSDDDMKNYDKVKDGFGNFFVVKKNIVFERACFNMRKQEANETVDAFVTALHALAEHCKYGDLHDELIRDRIVVGLADTQLSERMQLEVNLTLQKAIDMARQSEEVKKQQSALRSDASSVLQMEDSSIDRLIKKGQTYTNLKSSGARPRQHMQGRDKGMQQSAQCYKCGGPSHPRAECPANDAQCRGCGKKGHYQRVCRSKAVVACIEEEEEKSFFLGSVSCENNMWAADVQIKGKVLKFKLDTGADVTAISESDLKDLFPGAQMPILNKPEKPLLGPGKIQLEVAGYAKMQLTYKAKQTEEKVFVVKNLSTPLLGLPAITALGLLIRVDSVTMDSLKLEQAGVTLNTDKCELSRSEVVFLGHVITTSGIRPDPEKTKAIRDMKEPTNMSEMRSFLGMVNQVGKFIPQLAEKDKALCDLLSKKNCWLWGADQAAAFRALKEALTSPPVLAMYDTSRDTKVSADASSYGLGGVLLQKWDSEWRPVAYASLPTHPSELCPALPDRSMLVQKEREKRTSDAANFNRRHCAKPLSSLSPGQEVWITDTKTSGTVIQNHASPRSYLVDVPHGVVRRNRLHLIPLQSPSQDEAGQQQQEPLPVLEQGHTPPALGSPVPSPGVSTPRTRSGRAIKQPTRLDL